MGLIACGGDKKCIETFGVETSWEAFTRKTAKNMGS
jgi:hypothetical protein